MYLLLFTRITFSVTICIQNIRASGTVQQLNQRTAHFLKGRLYDQNTLL